MCDCQQQEKQIAQLSAHLLKVSGLVDALKMGTQEAWEYSEPLTVGGPSGNYSIKSPFQGECEYSVACVNSGPQIGQCTISSSPKLLDVDYTGGTVLDIGTNFSGFLFRLAINTFIPASTQFVPIGNSENTLFCHIGTSVGGAVFATIIFRQKRGVR